MQLILGIEYDGSRYSGWQVQPNVLTVQGKLEHAISKVADEEIRVFCASRTDSGVHAIAQVVHFYTNAIRSSISWISGINSNLPVDIVAQWIIESASVNFHARFSAIARKYRYVIYNHSVRPALLNKKVSYYKRFLDVRKMQNASNCLLGEQDFTAFRSLKCQSLSAFRNVHHLSVMRYGYYVIFDIQANSFLHHMVRNIIGSLVEVGWGRRPESWVAELLLSRDRSLVRNIASPYGLYLIKVRYPSFYLIPYIKGGGDLIFF